MQLQLVNKVNGKDFIKSEQNQVNRQASLENINQELKHHLLPSSQLVMPIPQEVLVDFALQLAHLALIRQNNHHGGVALVGHHDNFGVVVKVIVEIKSAGSFHHVHLDLGVLVHVEILPLGQIGIEWLLPLSC